MRTKRYVPKYWYMRRWETFERDNFTCQYCGQRAPNVQLEADHILSIADGGTDNLDNLKTACWSCNRGKANLWSFKKQKHRYSKGELRSDTLACRVMATLQQKSLSVEDILTALDHPNKDSIRTTVYRLRGTGELTLAEKLFSLTVN